MLGIFLDSETNGLNPQTQKILELAFKIVDLASGESLLDYQALIKQTVKDWGNSDPESLKINGFTWGETLNGTPLETVSQEIITHFRQLNIDRKNAVFICQNPSFDRAFFSQLIDTKTQELLNLPYHWLDLASMHWALSVDRAKSGKGPLPWETGISKDKIAQFYNLPPEKKPHRAMNGVTHLINCYEAAVGFPNSPQDGFK